MRLVRLIPAALALLLAGPAFAQDWIEYENREDMFRVNLPGQPTITEFTIVSEYDQTLPGRQYTANDQYGGHYVVKVINYDNTQVTDARGAIAYNLLPYRRGGGIVTFDAYAQIDRIEGHQLQITNADASRTYVALHLHAKRLYILEATVRPGRPPPAAFQVSLSILDAEGNSVRYNVDHDGQRLPARGGGQGGQGAGQAGGAN